MFRLIAILLAVTVSGHAHALVAATTTSQLNLRDAPSTNGRILLVMPSGANVAVNNCIAAQNWCQVTYAGRTGYAAGQFLSTTVAGRPVIVIEEPSVLDPLVVRPAEAVGQATVGVVGAVAGAFAGAATGIADAIRPAPHVVRFLDAAPVQPHTMTGQAAIGARVPPNVPLTVVPNASYMYAYINGRRVLVDPSTREIVYVVP